MEDREIKASILNNDVHLDEYCWSCDNDEEKKKTCEYCEGKGFQLTTLGERIVELIKRHG